jgi:hypothetical protein
MKTHTARIIGTTLLGSVLAAGCASVPFLAKPDPRWADYKSWTRITDGEPSTGASQALGGVHMGPEGYRDVYVNDVGLAMLTGNGPYDFPEGTVIVKEQFPDKAAWEASKGEAVTVSLKVADGEGIRAEDWNWAAGYKGRAQAHIADPNCVACHTAAVALNKSDYVFSVPAYLEAN